MSSLRLCSIPKCVYILTYLTVPKILFPSLYKICSPFASLYFLERPKSIKYIKFSSLSKPITQFSGFKSL